MGIHIKSFTGAEANKYMDELAALRIEVFREFPYLYEGSEAYEKEYLATFFHAKDNILVIAFDNDKIVGASTGLPLDQETDEVKQPWEEAGYDTSGIFYFGESVLKKAYRGQGIGVEFFKHREDWVQSLNRFDLITFCAVVRPDDHPLKPENYKPLDPFWKKRGYQKTDNLICEMAWQDIDQNEETNKPLHFWFKKLS